MVRLTVADEEVALCCASTATTVSTIKMTLEVYNSGSESDSDEKKLLVHCRPCNMEAFSRQTVRADILCKRLSSKLFHSGKHPYGKASSD